MLAWWMLLPTLLAMLVALVLPGFMWLRAGDHHGQQGRNQHPPGQHVLLLLSRGSTLADHLNDDG